MLLDQPYTPEISSWHFSISIASDLSETINAPATIYEFVPAATLDLEATSNDRRSGLENPCPKCNSWFLRFGP
jgi:hypothetical protein